MTFRIEIIAVIKTAVTSAPPGHTMIEPAITVNELDINKTMVLSSPSFTTNTHLVAFSER